MGMACTSLTSWHIQVLVMASLAVLIFQGWEKGTAVYLKTHRNTIVIITVHKYINIDRIVVNVRRQRALDGGSDYFYKSFQEGYDTKIRHILSAKKRIHYRLKVTTSNQYFMECEWRIWHLLVQCQTVDALLVWHRHTLKTMI